MFTEPDLGPAERTAAVHRVLLAESPEAGLAEHVTAGVNLEGLVEQVETDGTDQVIVQLGQLRLSFQQLLISEQLDWEGRDRHSPSV